jgi:hypothetical protein
MKRARFSRIQLASLIGLVVAGALALAGQAQPTNLFKEVSDRKTKIVWTNAPATIIPADVCNILGCVTGQDKYIARPKVAEGGKQVVRALILTHDAKKADLIVLRRDTPSDFYFFALAPDGTLQKAAYLANGSGKSWVQMGNMVSKPTFDKDKEVWLDFLAKLGSAPAAPAAAAAQPQG